ncbi:hypothetical protein [Aureibacillus halotolerans]|uniref:Sporulation and spore germination protein n=1 Tax=Aureibacillus halotolerans TaxID=1508390 RepID=A0A4R6U5S1_9BACI|nr:hypothetical protein [Aureibacillus halotolerans]TDQ41571.1 hypothetical protein EV213_103149 [Aureibacillus halotolerans]
MNKRRWTDKELESLLSELPKATDSQNADELYEKIQAKMQTEAHMPKKLKKRRSLVPVLSAVVAAVALLFVLVPMFPFQQDEMASPDQAMDSGVSSNARSSTSENDVGVTRSEDKLSPKEAEEEAVDQGEVPMMTMMAPQPHVLLNVPEDANVVKVPLLDPNAQFVVPVSFTVTEDATQEVLKNADTALEESNQLIDAPEVGLIPAMFNGVDIQTDTSAETVTLNFTQQQVGSLFVGSATDSLFVASLQEAFADNYSTVILQTEGQPGVDFQEAGVIEQVTLTEKQQRPYFLYSYGSEMNQHWLVPAPTAMTSLRIPSSFSEAVQFMKQVPEELPNISSALEGYEDVTGRVEGNEAVITFSETADFSDLASAQWMIEALLLTAEEYGADHVVFENAPVQFVGPYDLTAVNEVPLGPNSYP